jgi:hypothetical protein
MSHNYFLYNMTLGATKSPLILARYDFTDGARALISPMLPPERGGCPYFAHRHIMNRIVPPEGLLMH